MNNSKPKLDLTKLTSEQRSQLSAYHQGQAQLQALKDIADMTGEVINVLDKQANQEGIDKLGVLLVDMRESLKELNAKEAPEQPDTSKPVIDAISKLEKALTAAVSAQKAPVVNVPKADVPVVNIDAPDFSKVEKILKEIPTAFEKAVKGITIPENDDTNILQALSDLNKQLASIDTAVRMQPQAPTTVAVTNVDGSPVGGATVYSVNDIEDGTTSYFGKSTSDGTYQIVKVTDTSVSYATITNNGGVASYTDAWTNRATLTYGRYDQAF